MSRTSSRESLAQKLVLYSAAALATAGCFFVFPSIHHAVGIPSWVAYASLAPCIVAFRFLHQRIERDEQSVMDAFTAGRVSLTPAEFGTTYFEGDEARIAGRCRELFADYYLSDPTRIHPDDKLCEELHFALRDCLVADEFVMALEQEFHVKLSPQELQGSVTMRDFVKAISESVLREGK